VTWACPAHSYVAVQQDIWACSERMRKTLLCNAAFRCEDDENAVKPAAVRVEARRDHGCRGPDTEVRFTHARPERSGNCAKRFPTGIAWAINYDTTTFVSASMHDVVFTLGEALALVIAVVFLFLQSWRSTVIPAIAIPVSLIATLAVMLALGFSLNTVSMLGMVLAIGLVVDDAIVVGRERRAAARAGAVSDRCRRCGDVGGHRPDRRDDRRAPARSRKAP